MLEESQSICVGLLDRMPGPHAERLLTLATCARSRNLRASAVAALQRRRQQSGS
jgi:hypothetical protein